ncbi:MAG: flavodoxin [Dictyoglomaceae bacterium]
MDKNILIAFYSWSGNTKKIAKLIHDEVGGNLFEIEPEIPYPSSYNATVEQAKKEIKEGYKPPIKGKIENFEIYDVIFIGTPNWWSTIAPPVATFLTQYDFSGKTIAPFCSHGGGGLGKIAKDLERLCPNSQILEIFGVYYGGDKTLKEKLSLWLKKIGIKE